MFFMVDWYLETDFLFVTWKLDLLTTKTANDSKNFFICSFYEVQGSIILQLRSKRGAKVI